MDLPAQHRKQAEMVDKLYKDMFAASGEDAPDATGPDTGVTVPDQDDGVVEDSHHEEPGSSVGEQPSDDLEVWKQRYRTLQGMHRSEAARIEQLQASLREQQSHIERLEQLLASVSAPAEKKQEPELPTFVTDEDVDEYGEAIDVMRKVAKEELSREATRKIQELEEKIRQMQSVVVPKVEQVAQQQFTEREARFWDMFQRRVPDWETVNADQDFLSWLNEPDPLFGRPRQFALDEAQRMLDADRAAGIFEMWKAQAGRGDSKPSVGGMARELQAQVSPGRSKAVQHKPAGKVTFTTADITDFYDKVRRGRISEAERKQTERAIFEAVEDGRIVPT